MLIQFFYLVLIPSLLFTVKLWVIWKILTLNLQNLNHFFINFLSLETERLLNQLIYFTLWTNDWNYVASDEGLALQDRLKNHKAKKNHIPKVAFR